MFDRYFATHKEFQDGQTVDVTKCLGRFPNQEAAELAAKDRLWAKDGVRIRRETRIEIAWKQAERVLIRALRVACAAALGYVAYAWISHDAPSIGDIPLSQLTLAMLVSAIFYALIAVGVFWACMAMAFGDGPKDSPFD